MKHEPKVAITLTHVWSVKKWTAGVQMFSPLRELLSLWHLFGPTELSRRLRQAAFSCLCSSLAYFIQFLLLAHAKNADPKIKEWVCKPFLSFWKSGDVNENLWPGMRNHFFKLFKSAFLKAFERFKHLLLGLNCCVLPCKLQFQWNRMN